MGLNDKHSGEQYKLHLRKTDHMAFFVSDIDRAIEFYRDVLGMRFMFKQKDEEHDEIFAYFELEGGNLELLTKTGHPSPPGGRETEIHLSEVIKKGYCPHLALSVDNVEDAVAYLKNKNVSVIGGPFKIEDQVSWAYFNDPDGNIIELVHWMENK